MHGCAFTSVCARFCARVSRCVHVRGRVHPRLLHSPFIPVSGAALPPPRTPVPAAVAPTGPSTGCPCLWETRADAQGPPAAAGAGAGTGSGAMIPRWGVSRSPVTLSVPAPRSAPHLIHNVRAPGEAMPVTRLGTLPEPQFAHGNCWQMNFPLIRGWLVRDEGGGAEASTGSRRVTGDGTWPIIGNKS